MMIFSSTRQDSNESKTFAFDYSYWSFDGSKDRGDGYQMPDKGHSNGSKFCDQEKVRQGFQGQIQRQKDKDRDQGNRYQMPDKSHSNGCKFCDQEKVTQ